ncbi:hypothetical protein F4801DRAFT_580596 [Xylaria longipes]|nr:hypothetical protein F4801DRAFT_580596 [Xylaria longipes]RYC61491.1 hypothetical protein CHU98_g4700 [Xylaria longipes]
MATEKQPAALGPPKELPAQQSPPTLGVASGSEPSQPVEFRGFEFFSQREHNEYKDASRAYFAGKHGDPSSWLGDATPPASAHPSLDEPRPVPGGSSSPPNESESRNDKRILGLQRPWFWTVLGILGVIIVVAVGVGVGVGVGTRRAASGSKSASGVAPASDATGTTTTTTTMNSTSVMPVMSAMTVATSSSSSSTATRRPTAATPEATPGCPEINGTVYQVPGSTKKFLRLCGVDHDVEDGAIDVRNVYTNTSEDCIDNCAGTTGCSGCGWGFIEGDKGPPFRCWLKDNVKNGKSHPADKTWYFAVLL